MSAGIQMFDADGTDITDKLQDWAFRQQVLIQNTQLQETNTRYLLRARKAEGLLSKAMEHLDPTIAEDRDLHREIRDHLREPWHGTA